MWIGSPSGWDEPSSLSLQSERERATDRFKIVDQSKQVNSNSRVGFSDRTDVDALGALDVFLLRVLSHTKIHARLVLNCFIFSMFDTGLQLFLKIQGFLALPALKLEVNLSNTF